MLKNIKIINENQVNDTEIIGEIKLKSPGVVKNLISVEECLKNHEVNLEIKENSVPKFHRAYQVLYALKSAVEELVRLEKKKCNI